MTENHDFVIGATMGDSTKERGLSWVAKLKAEIKEQKKVAKNKRQAVKTHCSDFRYSRIYQVQARRSLMQQ
ncbi:hypothetical protein [Aliivibrio fischeri]|uniref:hypothetical protein n=1 Tax=Aliivibrio fischeri TaxID=668 RepID=UPI0002DF966A|nr:hypothetical protein [Aliivibrio fischeri]KLU79189.1 hypothetical protein AB192_06520 [Aliivibrio fischeri]